MGRYVLSFTACPMRRPECVTAARSYCALGDWRAVRDAIENDDILIIRSESSRKRIGLEITKRLRNLSDEELARLADCDTEEQTALVWTGICRTYEFIRDFLTDVVAVRWRDGLGNLPQGAYESYVEEASALHPELSTLSDGTKTRLRNQLFQMLREAGFIDKDDVLQAYLVPFGMEVAEDERSFFPTASITE